MKTAATIILGAVLYVNVAIALLVVAAGLGVFAFVVWFRNRDNLRALDALLKEKARAGHAALEGRDPTADGA